MLAPQFGDEQAAQFGVRGFRYESGLGEEGAPGWDLADGETGEETEGRVEEGDEGAGAGCAEAATGGDLKLGDEPAGSGGEMGAKAGDEAGGFVLGEAIEKEVGDDEVVAVGGGLVGAGVGAGDREAVIHSDAARPVAEEAEHGGAEVDGVGVERGIGGEEAGEEAAVSITENESRFGGGSRRGEGGEVVEAAAFEEGTEGEVFHPSVGAGETVEVRQAVGYFGHGISRRSGVRRMASAMMRMVRGEGIVSF